MQLAPAVQRYHELLSRSPFCDLAWAGQLQQDMRAQGLCDSGRVISPVLRPFFLSRSQAERLAGACSRVSAVLDRVQNEAWQNPDLLHRLQPLPAEKLLAGNAHGSTLTYSMEAAVHNGSLHISSVESCSPVGLGYARRLAQLFERTGVMQEFAQSAHGCDRLGCEQALLPAVRRLWKKQGKTAPPQIAVVQTRARAAHTGGEGNLLADLLSDRQLPARLIALEDLESHHGALRVDGKPVDLIFRRFGARDLLTHGDLSHPLFRACQEGSVYTVNGFRSDLARRRVLFELLTDGSLAKRDAGRIENCIPWTRFFARRKTMFENQEIELCSFVAQHREMFVLRPADAAHDKQSYLGSACDAATWNRALQAALQQNYVVQQCLPVHTELFPVLNYGELQMKELQVTLHAHVIEGELRGAVAQLDVPYSGSARPVAVAPVFVTEDDAA